MNDYQYDIYGGTSPRKLYNDEMYIPPKSNKRKKNKNNSKIRNKKIQELRRKKEFEKKEAREKFMKVTTIAVVLFFSAFLIIYRGAVADEEFRQVSKLKEQVEENQKENSQLKFNLQTAASILNIEDEARNKLGMTKLDPSQIRKVNIPREDLVERLDKGIIKDKEKGFLNTIIEKILDII